MKQFKYKGVKSTVPDNISLSAFKEIVDASKGFHDVVDPFIKILSNKLNAKRTKSKAMITSIQTGEFKRDSNSEWEPCIVINEDVLIIDSDCKPVNPPVYNFRTTIDIALFNLKIGNE